jgi:hypothetical protein
MGLFAIMPRRAGYFGRITRSVGPITACAINGLKTARTATAAFSYIGTIGVSLCQTRQVAIARM